jgi:putative ABC transport system substrate-binding protein
MLDRRRFLRTLGACLFAGPLTARAQSPEVRRIGVLEGTDAASGLANLDAFRQGLAELGHVEGRNLVIEYRSAGGRPERLGELAAELVRLTSDVIVTSGTPAALWAKRATTTTPIVMASSGEPVAEGVVASMARPGGNVTGLRLVGPPELGRERLRLLWEVVPRLTHVGVLWNPGNIYSWEQVRDADGVARSMGVKLKSLEFGSLHLTLDQAFEGALLAQLDALITMEDSLTLRHRGAIVEFAAMSRLPVIYGLGEFVEAGGLLAYGADRRAMFRRAATYVDRILKGARPAELPIEPPTRFELVINLKTARALALTISPALLRRADRVVS